MSNIFKAREIDSLKSGWVCDLSGPDAVNPDAYFFFTTRTSAQKFVELIDSGLSVYEARLRQEAAATLGHHQSASKTAAARENGRKGGRPSHFKVVWQYQNWVRLEDAEPMLDGSQCPWEGTWAIWSSDYGIVPDFYFHKTGRPHSAAPE